MSAIPQPLPYFGRAWQVTIQTQGSGVNEAISAGIGPGVIGGIPVPSGAQTLTISNANQESLRVVFEVETKLLMAYWQATVSIYNMAPATGSQIQATADNLSKFWEFNQPLSTGDRVTVSAGYLKSYAGAFSPNANLIYDGRVLQTVWTRENVVDWKLTLRCYVGLIENSLNFVTKTLPGPASDLEAVNFICQQSKFQLTPNIDAGAKAILDKTKVPYAQTFHDRPYDIIATIAGKYKGQLFPFVSPNGVGIRSFDSANIPVPDYAYAPLNSATAQNLQTNQGVVKYTLIGSPQQTQNGVTFRVLMDSAVKIGDVVQIAPGVLINLFPFQPGKDLPPVPARNGIYVVSGIRHFGDTRGRGDDWYTEITGVVSNFFANFLGASNPNKQAQAK